MSEKKYEITKIAHPQYPWLHRIRALRDVRENVRAGDLGGFVQSEENLSHEGQSWITDNAVAAEEAYVHGDAILWGHSCICGSAAISGPSRIGGNAIIEDYAIITAGYVHGNVHISGNAKLFANSVTGGIPIVMEGATVYGELGGEIEVRENVVILPGITIDNPTSDVIHIGPDEIAIERKFKRESPILTPPPGFQHKQHTNVKKRIEEKNDKQKKGRMMPLNQKNELAQVVEESTLPIEHNGGDGWTILHRDTLQIIRAFKPQVFDALITDPPYASGGWKPSEKNRTTNQKYSSMDPKNALPDFDGDNRDQRSWTRWMAEWLSDARKACKPGAPVCLFIDWRQYPSITDALQWAGWIWRGSVVWDKMTSRPQKGCFRQQSEYVVWGSNGPMPVNRPVGCLPGVFRYANPQNRTHVTEKPLQLMRDLVKICVPGGRILDPFCGAGTTVLAAKLEGYEAVGIEVTDAYYQLGSDRVRFALESHSKAEETGQ